ncbi:hypothetical protein PENSPDRAFT_681782 [Peniophora sp. CONT]|nr:hypothetical protein PENSPDRAFT_681782 [Peniophora sp. CONT]
MSAADAFYVFDGGQRMGASAVFAFSLLSTMALAIVSVRVAYVVSIAYAKGAAVENVGREGYFLLKTQLGQFAGSLLLANLFTAISGVIEIQWIALDGVQHGSTCNSQGVFSQIGEFATAYFIVVMGIHTFITLVLRTHHAAWFVLSSIIVGWVAAVIIAAAPVSVFSTSLGPLYGFVVIDCGISRAYPVAHILLYFIPLFLSAFTSVIIYSLIFLVLRGNITVNGGLKFHMVAQGNSWRSRDSSVERYMRFVRSVAKSMIWFPVAFMVCIIPNAICQLLETSGYSTASGGQTFTLVLRHMNGVLDVLIFYNVLRVLGPALETGAMTEVEKAMGKDSAPTGSARGTGYGRSFLDDDDQGLRPFAPLPSPNLRKPWQTHKTHGSDGSNNSRTHLLPTNGNTPMSYTESAPSASRQAASDLGHGRNVTKQMISKPVPVGLDVPTAIAPAALSAEISQHRADNTAPLSDLLRTTGNKPHMPRKAMHKPLPLLPELRKSLARFSFHHMHAPAAASTSKRVAPPAVPPPRLPEASLAPIVSQAVTSTSIQAVEARPVEPEESSPTHTDEQDIVLMPFSATSATSRRHTLSVPGDRATAAVISMYMHRRSARESALPDFPITASDWLEATKTPHAVKEEARDYIGAAPPPRSLRSRSPSPQRPAPAKRTITPPRRGASANDAPPATAVVTEFDMNDYMASPPPPMPALPRFVKEDMPQDCPTPNLPSPDIPCSVAQGSPAQTEMDMTDYYTDQGHGEERDEVPGLPPLPQFRPRLTVYDDELSIYSAVTSTFGFGSRPRESPGAVRALPLPPSMRLELMVSPIKFDVSTPKVVTPQSSKALNVPPTRGFRPIP